jgi:hypothetical protein
MDDDPFQNFRITPARLWLCTLLAALLLAAALIWRPEHGAQRLFAPQLPPALLAERVHSPTP